MQNKKLFETLLLIGLNTFQAKIYLVLLENFFQTPTELAKRLGVQRLKIYLESQKLFEMELLTKEKRGKNVYFKPANPEKITFYLKKSQRDLELAENVLKKILPEYKKRFLQENFISTTVKVYEGRQRFVELFEEILILAEKQIYHFGSNKDTVEILGWEMAENWVKRRIEKQIYTKEITFPNEFVRQREYSNPLELRETKVLSSQLEISASYIIFGSKIAIWNSVFPKIVVIEDSLIVNLIKLNFELLWTSLPR